MTETPPPGRPSTGALLRYFLYLGSLGFGGSVALVGYMQRDLVERRPWFSREACLKSLALSQLAPGPLAAQLAICLGYVHSRIAGACVVLTRRAIVDVPSVLIGLAALGAAWRFKVPEPVLIAAGAVAGIVIVAFRG